MTIGNFMIFIIMITTMIILGFISLDYVDQSELRTDQRQLIQETLNSLKEFTE